MNVRLTRCGELEIVNGSVRVPSTDVGLLSAPGKMPCPSWSLPAISSCPGAWFGPGGICGASKSLRSCYATSGRYTFDLTLRAQAARFAWTVAMMRDAVSSVEWAEYMAAAIDRATRATVTRDGRAHFRWHDSGDVFSSAYAAAICWVIEWTPDVDHWLPTRSWRLAHLLPGLQAIAALPNVAVKPSALRFGDPPPIVPGLGAGTSADIATRANCPAPGQGGECRDCRHCWGKTSETVYAVHGLDVHGLGTGHRPPVSIAARDERLAAFMAHWRTHFDQGGN